MRISQNSGCFFYSTTKYFLLSFLKTNFGVNYQYPNKSFVKISAIDDDRHLVYVTVCKYISFHET